MAKTLLATGIGPINGDFELVEAGMAFAIFVSDQWFTCFGGYLHQGIANSGHMESKRNSGQTTLLLQYPLWWGYAASMLGAFAAALVAVYVALSRLVEVTTGRVILFSEQEADL